MPNSAQLGHLNPVDIRQIWREEPAFSAWLAEDENLSLLGEALNLEMEADETEAAVGNYAADILAHDISDGSKIIIENQYSTTDHDHLGKLITYASGRDAKVLIWIVEKSRDEHRSAVQWLNEHTDEGIAVFLVKITVYRIGNSDPAPQFTILEQPNNWQRATRNESQNSEIHQHQRQWWTDFASFLSGLRGTRLPFSVRNPPSEHWMDFAIGTSHANMSVKVVRNNLLGAEVYIGDDKPLFDRFYAQREAIERDLGFTAEWQRLDNKKASRIIVTHIADFETFSTATSEQRKVAFEWYKEKLCAFYKAFHSRFR